MIDRIWQSIDGLVSLGGPVVLVLLCASVVALAIVIAKLWQFAALGVGRHAVALAALSNWDRGDADTALALAGGNRALLSRVALAAMRGHGLPHQEPDADAEDRVLVETERQLHGLEKGFRALDAIAQLSPLMGLFGTVLGMIEAFRQLQQAGSGVDPSLLAGGIWVALLTTAVGLAVAMPASLLLTWLESRVADERIAAQAIIATAFRPGRDAGSLAASGMSGEGRDVAVQVRHAR